MITLTPSSLWPYKPRASKTIAIVLSLRFNALSCAKEDNCVALGERMDTLHASARDEDAFACGITYYEDSSFTHKIAECLAAHLGACEPAFGSFLASAPGSDIWTIRWVSIDDACEATVLVMKDPDAPDAPFTEFTCTHLEATGDASVITWGMCGEKIEYSWCDTE